MPEQTPDAPRTRVLIADDDPAALDLLRAALERAGYETVAVPQAARVLPAAREVRPRAILLDIMMPGSDGYALLISIRADPALRDVPVILVSGEPKEVHEELGREMGAQGYLQKPFDVAELRRTLAEAIARGAAP